MLTQRLKQAGIGVGISEALVGAARYMKAAGIKMADFASPKKLSKDYALRSFLWERWKGHYQE